MPPIISIQGVTKSYATGFQALKLVNLDIDRGEIFALLGPNGAGKTTLFNIISGFNTPTEGRVSFGGGDITGVAPELIAKRGLIRTFQLVQLFEGLTVLENVKVGRHLHTRGGLLTALMPGLAARREAAVEETAWALLQQTGLADYAAMLASALPYGRKRLLEIARALAAEPKLLLLDEPAAGLNREETQRLADLLGRIAAAGTAVLLIEHDMNLVMNVAARIAVLDFGRMIANGTPAEIRRNPDVIAAYLGSAEAALA